MCSTAPAAPQVHPMGTLQRTSLCPDTLCCPSYGPCRSPVLLYPLPSSPCPLQVPVPAAGGCCGIPGRGPHLHGPSRYKCAPQLPPTSLAPAVPTGQQHQPLAGFTCSVSITVVKCPRLSTSVSPSRSPNPKEALGTQMAPGWDQILGGVEKARSCRRVGRGPVHPRQGWQHCLQMPHRPGWGAPLRGSGEIGIQDPILLLTLPYRTHMGLDRAKPNQSLCFTRH